MLTKFWEGLGGELATRWAGQAFAPAFVFWAGGLLAWGLRFGWDKLTDWFGSMSFSMQLVVLAGGLIVVAGSAAVAEWLTLPVLRFLEGLWPRWLGSIRRWTTSRLNERLDQAEQRWQVLSSKGLGALSEKERDEYIALDQRLRLAPAAPEQRMPTRLGNILRAAETRPRDKYSLDSIVCWPRLWLLLSDDAKKDITEARTGLDKAITIWLWSVLFMIWTMWAWWALPVGFVAAFVVYRRALGRAEVYGDLVEATFDVHRVKLYQALRWPLPATPEQEKPIGEEMTKYLLRGSGDSTPVFTPPA